MQENASRLSEHSHTPLSVRLFRQKPVRWFLPVLLLCWLGLAGCTDGLVVDPVPEFSERQLVLPKQTPSPERPPKTTLEKASRRLKSAREQVTPYLGTALIVLCALVILFRFLHLIYELSTTSPD